MPATFYSQAAEEAAAKVLDAFRSPETLPKALATIALPTSETHASGYSLRNQLIVWLFGYTDAAGYKQWLKYGRQVRKGEKAFPVLAPVTASFTKWDEEKKEDVRVTYIKGWKHVKVFGVEQTDIIDQDKWARYSEAAAANEEFLNTLPWTEVARAWDLATSADGNLAKYGVHGCYRHGVSVEVAVENLSTWAHEIIHAADDRCGTLTKASSPTTRSWPRSAARCSASSRATRTPRTWAAATSTATSTWATPRIPSRPRASSSTASVPRSTS
jgi:hypothetical protein